MATYEQFRKLWSGIAPDAQAELYSLLWSFPETTLSLIVETLEADAVEQGVSLLVEEVRGFMCTMEDDGDFSDIEDEAERLLRFSGDRRNNTWRMQPLNE